MSSLVEVLLNLIDTNGGTFTVRLKNLIYYVPGLTQKFFSVSQFAQNNNTSEMVKNFIYTTFIDRAVTCPLFLATRVAFYTTIAQQKLIKSTMNKIGNLRPVSLETLHHRFDHINSNAIMFS
jgi:hypothetical protein